MDACRLDLHVSCGSFASFSVEATRPQLVLCSETGRKFGRWCVSKAPLLTDARLTEGAVSIARRNTIDVAFTGWIRPELSFDTIELLVRRMDEDSRLARIALARAPDAFPRLGLMPG